MDILQYFDLFPEKISLFHKGNKDVRNLFSIIISLIILSCMIISIFLFGENFFKRLNPQVIFKNIETGEYPFFKLNYFLMGFYN